MTNKRLTIYCYGDSNTWGYSPYGGSRFAKRWPKVLEAATSCRLFENGMSGRTVCDYWGTKDMMSAEGDFLKHTSPLKESNILFYYLGINDILGVSESSLEQIVAITTKLLDEALRINNSLTVSLIAPLDLIADGPTMNPQEQKIQNKIEALKLRYKELSDGRSFHYIDPNIWITASLVDGVHIEEKDHIRLGNMIAKHLPYS